MVVGKRHPKAVLNYPHRLKSVVMQQQNDGGDYFVRVDGQSGKINLLAYTKFSQSLLYRFFE